MRRELDKIGSESEQMAEERRLPAAADDASSSPEIRALDLVCGVLEALPEPEHFLERLMDLAVVALRVERACMLFFHDGEGSGYPAIVRGLGEAHVSGLRSHFSTQAVAEMKRAGTVVVVPDAASDVRFKDSKSITQGRILSLLAAPIRSGETLVGAIYVDVRHGRREFTERDRQFIETVAKLAGKAIEKSHLIGSLRRENLTLKDSVTRYTFQGIIGTSPAMQRVFRDLERIFANRDPVTVLVEGENGTGKTKAAELIHDNSPRAKRPFVPFSSAAVTETLAESELFGHMRGSFTGAMSDKKGLVAEAEGGTIFLDDVDTLPPSVQAKLLRFLQEREIRPVGGMPRKVDVRVLCATNADLRRLVREGKFREDLYFRINFVTLTLPPLRERKEDIPLLARHFLEEAAGRSGRSFAGFSTEVLTQMMAYAWPGNVRELESEIAHAVTMSEGPYVTLHDFKLGGFRLPGQVVASAALAASAAAGLDLDQAVDELVKNRLLIALEANKGKIARSARALNISRGRFYDLARKYGINLG